MAIEKKLIHFGKLADFEAQLTAGNILDRSIVFIQDAKKIWTHGTYYDCSEGTEAGDIVQSDWNENDPVSDSYIQGRTHYSYDVEQIALFSIASKNEGDILVTGLYDGGFYKLYNQAGGKSQSFHFVEGRKVPIPSVGPSIEAVCTYEDDYCLKLTTPTYGMNESFSLREMYVEQLIDIYVPETIARTSELKTINGESILGEGDITIEGGSSLTESDIAAMGFTKNTGTYSKPSGGIPKTDLASAVQTSLGKADTALQSYTEQYKGTVTGVKINGSTKNPSNGVVDLGTVITSHQSLSNYYTKSEVDSKITSSITNAINASY